MISVILMMAGSGTRMNSSLNKVFLPLGSKLIYQYSLDLFLEMGYEVICVIKEEDQHKLQDYESKIKIAYGGKTRQESVYNGLKLATKKYTLIHDGARPFISKENILKCEEGLNEGYAVLLGSSCKDSVYQMTPLTNLNRENLFNAQTPQGGSTIKLKQVHKMALDEDFKATDDISLVLKYSNEIVKIIEGNDTNFKITTQLDYILAKELVKNYD